MRRRAMRRGPRERSGNWRADYLETRTVGSPGARREKGCKSSTSPAAYPTCVNARILLRQDNFDRPFLLFLPTVDHLQGSLLFVLLLAKIDATTPPYGWSPPPGPSVVDGWRRDERTRDRPQSKLECARLVCQAYHRHPGSTTSRPPRPRLAHSRCPQGRAAPPQATPVRLVPFESLACARVRYPPLADFACAKQELTLLSFLTPRLSERPTIFHAVTGTVNRNDLRMMQEPVEQGGGENLVSQ